METVEETSVRPLSVTHVITKGSPMGGTQIDTFHLLQWQQQGHEVTVVMGNDGPLREACQAAGIPATVIRMENRFLSPWSDLQALRHLVRYMTSRRPEVVHTHSSKAGLLGRLAARFAGVPVVVHTLHVLPYHDRQPPLLRTALVVLERGLSGMTTHLVAVAETLREDFLRRRICSREGISTIGSGIDFSAFPADAAGARARVRAELGIAPAAPVVISVANLEPRKRYDLLVDAAARVAELVPDAYFLIAGTGEMHAAIAAQIERLGLRQRVMLLGYRSDAPELLAASDVFVQTSQLEGLSRSLIEAMYSSLPVVATDTDGTRELVVHGVTGLVIPEGDAPALSRALTALLANPDRRRALGSAGKEAVGERWSVEAMGRAHDALYEQLHRAKVPAR